MNDEIVIDGVIYVRKRKTFDFKNVCIVEVIGELEILYDGKVLGTIGIDFQGTPFISIRTRYVTKPSIVKSRDWEAFDILPEIYE